MDVQDYPPEEGRFRREYATPIETDKTITIPKIPAAIVATASFEIPGKWYSGTIWYNDSLAF